MQFEDRIHWNRILCFNQLHWNSISLQSQLEAITAAASLHWNLNPTDWNWSSVFPSSTQAELRRWTWYCGEELNLRNQDYLRKCATVESSDQFWFRRINIRLNLSNFLPINKFWKKAKNRKSLILLSLLSFWSSFFCITVGFRLMSLYTKILGHSTYRRHAY